MGTAASVVGTMTSSADVAGPSLGILVRPALGIVSQKHRCTSRCRALIGRRDQALTSAMQRGNTDTLNHRTGVHVL